MCARDDATVLARAGAGRSREFSEQAARAFFRAIDAFARRLPGARIAARRSQVRTRGARPIGCLARVVACGGLCRPAARRPRLSGTVSAMPQIPFYSDEEPAP